MGCQTEVYLGSYLTFSICTHNPATAALTDADDSPTYRIYEDETVTAILSGCLAKLDDGNTTGFYTEKVDCSASNGFESSKTYTVYIEATVNSDTGGISYGFRSLAPDATASGMWTYAARTITGGSVMSACLSNSTITASTFDNVTAFPKTSADVGPMVLP